MELITKEVHFDVFCPKCVNWDKKDVEEPCNECLSYPCNEHSVKPLNYKEKVEEK